jgi:hypothetical protein
MILHSKVIPNLRERGLSVGIITPNADEENIKKFATRYEVTLAKLPPLSVRRLSFYGKIRPYLYEDVRRNPALWSKHLRAVEEAKTSPHLMNRWRPYLHLLINKMVGRSRPIRELFARLERMLLADAQAAQLIQSLKPALLVSTYPVDASEACLLLEAQRASIATVGQLLSWDNITAKGRFTVVPDYFVAWGPIMSDELREYYQVKPDKIIEAGVAHFDAHITGANPEGTRVAISRLGLEANKPYIFFGMMSPIFTPYEIEVVEWLAREVEANRFGPEMQLVIRPHPQNVQGYTADTSWLPRLDALASRRVGIDYPILEDSALMWNMNEEDLPKLSNLIAGCAASLNSGSTLSIDAILHDKPVVLTMFDAGHELPWWQSIYRGVSYYHLEKLIKLKGVRVTRSFEEMAAAISAYLSNPALDAEERAEVRRQETGPADGLASRRVAEALVHFLSRTKYAEQRSAEPAKVVSASSS